MARRRLLSSGPRRTAWDRWPGPTFHAGAVFRAPMGFVFEWCTDFTTNDGPIGGESYVRKIIHRGPRLVVLEDLEETGSGWDWARLWVKLRPPNHWQCETVGNHHDFTIDYDLTERSGGRTRLDLRWKVRPNPLELPRPRKAETERMANRAWKHRKVALERDFRESRGRGRIGSAKGEFGAPERPGMTHRSR